MGRLIMGSEGPMGQLVYACSIKVNEQDRLVSIRSSPINAALAMLAWLNDHPSDPSFWTISVWDMTSMGEHRHMQVGAVSGPGEPSLATVDALATVADEYLDNLGRYC